MADMARRAAEEEQKRRAEARRNRTRFNPNSRVNERFWGPGPFNLAAQDFGSLDGSENPAQIRPPGPVINEQGPLLSAIDRAVNGGTESEGPGSKRANTSIGPTAVPTNTTTGPTEDALHQANPPPNSQTEGLGFFSHSESQTFDELFNEEPEG